MPKAVLKVGDLVEIVVRVNKETSTLRGAVSCLKSKGKLAEIKVGNRKVTAFTSQITKVEK